MSPLVFPLSSFATVQFDELAELVGRLAVTIEYNMSGPELNWLVGDGGDYLPRRFSHPHAVGNRRHVGVRFKGA
jgi:hypothetical protein